MPADRNRLPPLGRWMALFAVWTLLALLYGAQLYVYEAANGRSISLARAVGLSMLGWYSWAILCPLILPLIARFRLDPDRWMQRLPIHIVASVVFTLAKLAIQSSLAPFVYGKEDSFAAIFVDAITRQTHIGIITYWMIVAVSHAIHFLRQSMQRQLAASRAEAHLAVARLEALRMQLQPHFMFNTLHAAMTLMRDDIDAAERMLVRMSELLRASLDDAGVQEVPLARELELARCYLSIEETRFSDRLQVEFRIDAGVHGAAVPTLILQPLLENAIRHGIGRSGRTDRIEVQATQEGARLRLEVRNRAGSMESESGTAGRGVGLSNTRARLTQLYGAAQQFDLTPLPGGGVSATILLPFRLEPRPMERA